VFTVDNRFSSSGQLSGTGHPLKLPPPRGLQPATSQRRIHAVPGQKSMLVRGHWPSPQLLFYKNALLCGKKNLYKIAYVGLNGYMTIASLEGLFGLKVHKIEIFFGFDFEICNISLIIRSKY
jgi:hypothetical protein